MVAVIEATNVSSMGFRDVLVSGRPMTVVVLHPQPSVNGESKGDRVSHFSAEPAALDGEPTWEDAAWQ